MIIPGEDDGVLTVEDPQSSDAAAVHGFFIFCFFVFFAGKGGKDGRRKSLEGLIQR